MSASKFSLPLLLLASGCSTYGVITIQGEIPGKYDFEYQRAVKTRPALSTRLAEEGTCDSARQPAIEEMQKAVGTSDEVEIKSCSLHALPYEEEERLKKNFHCSLVESGDSTPEEVCSSVTIRKQ